MPRQIFDKGQYTLSGTYFSLSGNSGSINVADTHNAVNANIDGWDIKFSDPKNGGDIKWDYDFSWGSPDYGFLIIGSTTGGYHIVFLGDQKIDWSSVKISYPGSRVSGPDNYFIVTINGVEVKLTQDTTGTAPTRYTPCYLQGSKLETPRGRISVEDLKIGDEVYVYQNSTKHVERVCWAGSGTVTVNPEKADDLAGYPVVIQKDAIVDGVPFEDLRVTSEHCICIDNKLIPIRMLVNGTSIRYDKKNDSYKIYHFKTKQHSIVNVNGLLAETLYGRTVEAGLPTEEPTMTHAHNKVETLHARPLGTSRDFVEPIFNRIIQRCGKKYERKPEYKSNIDRNIRMLTDLGIIYPTRLSENIAVFHMDKSINEAHLLIETFRPCDTEGPFVDDRRNLGVRVKEAIIFCSNSHYCHKLNLLDDKLKGWHNIEHDNTRWTTGKAEILMPVIETPNNLILSLIFA